MIIDAHHHLWDPRSARHAWLDELPPLNRPFSLADFERVSEPAGVTAGVLVQVRPSTAETADFLALAGRSPGRVAGVVGAGRSAAGVAGVAGVVGWADLTSAGIAEELFRLRSGPGGDRLVGLRHLVQDEPDPGWLRRPDVRRGLQAVGAAGLAYDLLIRPHQLPAALDVTELDGVRFVLDHGAKPDIAAGRFEPWATGVAELARRPNVVCKLSGLVTEAGPGWTPEQLKRYAGQLLDCFGPDRLMFGSDWPVCTLVASYPDVLALARTMTSQLDRTERAAVFAGTAITAYRLRAG